MYFRILIYGFFVSVTVSLVEGKGWFIMIIWSNDEEVYWGLHHCQARGYWLHLCPSAGHPKILTIPCEKKRQLLEMKSLRDHLYPKKSRKTGNSWYQPCFFNKKRHIYTSYFGNPKWELPSPWSSNCYFWFMWAINNIGPLKSDFHSIYSSHSNKKTRSIITKRTHFCFHF